MAGVPSRIPPRRLLLGPGPSNVHPRVLARARAAAARPSRPRLPRDRSTACRRGLRRLFGTENRMTLPLSGTGQRRHGGLPRESARAGRRRCVIGVAGVFGERMCEVARRAGAQRDARRRPSPARCSTTTRWPRRSRACGRAWSRSCTPRPRPACTSRSRHRRAPRAQPARSSCSTASPRSAASPVDARRLGHRRRLQRHAEVSLLPAGPLAGELRRARARARARAPRARARAGTSTSGCSARYFGERARLPPHGADRDDPAAWPRRCGCIEEEGMEARIARHRERRRSAGRRHRRARLRAARRGAPPAPDAHVAAASRSRRARPAKPRCGGACSSATASRSAAGSASSPGRIWRIGLMGENARLTSVESLFSALRREIDN